MSRFVFGEVLERKKSKIEHIHKILGHFTPAQILVAGFAGLIILGTILLTLPISSRSGQWTPFIDAFFTATSATCVTGLVVVDTGTYYSVFGQMVILGLIQMGGLGIMTMTTIFALIVGKKINLKERLIMREALNSMNLEGVVRLTRSIIGMTLLIEGLGAVILAVRFSYDVGWRKGIYFGFFHSVSAFCNAGFDLFGSVYGKFTSMTHYVNDPVVSLTVPVLFILGGLGFIVIGDVARNRRFSRLSLHSKIALILTLSLITSAMVLFWLFESRNTIEDLGLMGSVLAAFFQSVTPRTAGFNTLDIAALTQATQFLIIILMFIGACPGGTGGGIKTTTFGALVMGAWSIVTGRTDAEVFGRRLPSDAILKSLAITLWAATLVIFITMTLTFTEQANFLMILFETVSAFGTVGLSMGLTTHLSDFGKVLIVLTMFAGRVGPLTVMLAIWQRQQVKKYRYPEERLIVG